MEIPGWSSKGESCGALTLWRNVEASKNTKQRIEGSGSSMKQPNKALHRTAIPLRSIAADELGRCADEKKQKSAYTFPHNLWLQ